MQPWEYHQRPNDVKFRKKAKAFLGRLAEASFMVGGIYVLILVKTLKEEIKYQKHKKNNSTSSFGVNR